MMNELNKIIQQNKQTNTKQSEENDDWMYK